MESKLTNSAVTYSRCLSIAISSACYNQCAYCGFWTSDRSVLSLADARELLAEGRRRGCREALILSGERPWEVEGFPLNEDQFVDYLYELSLLALRAGLLPHTNVGTLSYEALGRLRAVNVSMGLMLETLNDSLAAHRHRSGAGKRGVDRLRHLEDAGRWRIPITTGILVGIGESREDRHAALEAIAAIHRRYGHIQEVIIQNFKPKNRTAMACWPEPDLQDMLDSVRYARRLMPDTVIQIPPNLNLGQCLQLLMAGANDLGGISTNGDVINPESLNPELEKLNEEISPGGYRLMERLPVHPEVDADLQPVADTLRRELVGERVTYVVNCNINFTNICSAGCTFCAFRHGAGNAQSFSLDLGVVLDKVRDAVALGATEVCIQGGLNPQLDLDYYTGMLARIRAEFPALHIHAFSPMEIFFLSVRHGMPVSDVLAMMKDNGLSSMPGTAAEILVDEVRKELCPDKLSTAEWVDVVTTAHRMGIRTTATIMFGHIESWRHRVRHLEVLRNIQLDTGGFTEFVLLPFLPGLTPLALKYNLTGPPLRETLKLTAYARIFFGQDLVNIQTSWVKLGVGGAQECLRWGANDFGGTLMEENISRLAGGENGEYLPPERIRAAILKLGRMPSQRDSLYKPIDTERVINSAREY